MNKHYGWITLTILTASSLFADVVMFKSGDKLTGKVIQMADGTMSFDSTAAGSLTLNMADIQTFSTDEDIIVEKSDGSQFKLKATMGETGKISLKEGDTSMSIADITEINPKEPKWTGALVAGANFTRGNTKSDTANLSVNAEKRRENDRISLAGAYRFDQQRDNSTGKDSTTTDNWFINGKYDYFMSEKTYFFGTAKYEKDRIANLDMRVSPGAGVGYQWIEKSDLNFFTEGGGSWIYERYTEPSKTRKYMTIRLAYHFDKSFNEYVKVFHNVEFLPSTEDVETYLLNADAGVQTKLIDRWVMEAKVELDYNSQPADNRDKKDYRYILGVGWTF